MTKAATKPVAATPAKVVEGVANPAAEVKPTTDADAVWVRTKSGVARRFRAGLAFSAEPIMLPVGELSQEQLDAIEADPLLMEVDAPVADAATTEAAE
jgi:hypothetical protein